MGRASLQSLPTEIIAHIAELVSSHGDKYEKTFGLKEPRVIVCRSCLSHLRLTCSEIKDKVHHTWLKGFSNVIGHTSPAGLIHLSNMTNVKSWARRVSTMTIHWPREDIPVPHDELHQKFLPILYLLPNLERVRVCLDMDHFMTPYHCHGKISIDTTTRERAQNFYLATLRVLRASSIKLKQLHVGTLLENPYPDELEFLDVQHLETGHEDNVWLSNIEKLTLRLHFEEYGSEPVREAAIPERRLQLAEFVTRLPALREFSLNFWWSMEEKTIRELVELDIPHLEVLTLNCFCEKMKSFTSFIHRHQKTLRQVCLSDFEGDHANSEDGTDPGVGLLLDTLSQCKRLKFLMLDGIYPWHDDSQTTIFRCQGPIRMYIFDEEKNSPLDDEPWQICYIWSHKILIDGEMDDMAYMLAQIRQGFEFKPLRVDYGPDDTDTIYGDDTWNEEIRSWNRRNLVVIPEDGAPLW